MRVQRYNKKLIYANFDEKKFYTYIKYLKPANEKCLISGILVFLCKIRRNGRKKTDAKRRP